MAANTASDADNPGTAEHSPGAPRIRARRSEINAISARGGRFLNLVPTPVPVHNFDQIPVFDSDPYDYGTPVSIGGGQPASAGA